MFGITIVICFNLKKAMVATRFGGWVDSLVSWPPTFYFNQSHTTIMSKKSHLPAHGQDWIEGLTDCYIILSISNSTPVLAMFWACNETAYTDCLLTATIYTKADIIANIDRYNDGLSTAAIPLTRAALTLIGLYPIGISPPALEDFLTIETFVNTDNDDN